MLNKRCCRCGLVKQVSEFNYRNKSKGTYSHLCKICTRTYYVENKAKILVRSSLRRATPEFRQKRKVYIKRYVKSEKGLMMIIRRKLRELCLLVEQRGDSVDVVIRKRFGNKCLNCGAEKDLTIDHVVPLASGGINGLTNMQLLCRICNSRKALNQIDYRANFTGAS